MSAMTQIAGHPRTSDEGTCGEGVDGTETAPGKNHQQYSREQLYDANRPLFDHIAREIVARVEQLEKRVQELEDECSQLRSRVDVRGSTRPPDMPRTRVSGR